jgi:hypothetical protein
MIYYLISCCYSDADAPICYTRGCKTQETTSPMDSVRVCFWAEGPKYMSSMVEETQFLHEE